MSFASRVVLGGFTSALLAFVGPCIQWLIWPPSATKHPFAQDLIFLMWPTQSLGVVETYVGFTFAVIVAVGANVLLFGLIGMLVGTLVSARYGLVTMYIVVEVLVVVLAIWGAGFDDEYLNVAALALAMVIFSIPFAIVKVVRGKR